MRYMYGSICIMSYITQTWNTKPSNKVESPTCNRLLSPEDKMMPALGCCKSWRSRILAKMRECCNAIQNVIAFDRLLPNTDETARPARKCLGNNSSILSGAMTSVSSIPDIITFSDIAVKHKEYGDESIVMDDSPLNSDDELNTSVERENQLNKTNDSDCFFSAKSTISNSLKSQIKNEYEDSNRFALKKRISAEPFLSYTEGTTKFVWMDDITEENLSSRTWNSLDCLNSSDINDFGNPCTNSTLCENSVVNKSVVSSPVRSLLQDSGFENNLLDISLS